MKFIILLLAFGAGVSCEEYAEPQEANRRMSTSYTTSIIHGEAKDGHGIAQSSVKVNLHSAQGLQNQILSQSQPNVGNVYSHNQDAIYNSYIQNYAYPYQGESSSASETYEMKPVSAQESTYQYQVVQPLQATSGNYQNQIPGTDSYIHYTKMPVELPLMKNSPGYGNPPHYQTVLGQYQTRSIQSDARSFTPYQDQPEQLPQALPLQAPATQTIQGAQPNSDSLAFLQYAAPKQVNNYNNPKEQQQLYNVGYSINIENVTPKLMYRVPDPPPLNRFRQQKLLNADVITGTNKETVEKPTELTQSINNLEISQSSPVPSNYLQDQNIKAPQILTYDNEKPSHTQVYSDIRNTHGYTWKTLSPGVEISGYHNLEEPTSSHQQTQAQHFDHAAALGRSQGFDISNAVDTGNSPSSVVHTQTTSDTAKTTPTQTIQYQQSPTTTYNLPTYNQVHLQPSSYKPTTNRQSHNLKFSKGSSSGNVHYGSSSNSIQTTPLLQASNKDIFNFQQSGIELLNIPSLKSNFGTGGNLEFDKSLLDGFYKTYNPSFFLSELTLPSTMIPQSISLGATPNSFGKYNYKTVQLPVQSTHYQPVSQVLDPQLMVNQHYAFVQAEGANAPLSNMAQNTEVKPTHENQHEQQAQQSKRHEILQKPTKEIMRKINENEKDKKKSRTAAPSTYKTRPHSMNDKDFNLERNLRPPPMIIIHQKY